MNLVLVFSVPCKTECLWNHFGVRPSVCHWRFSLKLFDVKKLNLVYTEIECGGPIIDVAFKKLNSDSES